MKLEWERLKAWVMMDREQQKEGGGGGGGGVGRAGYVHPDLALVDVVVDPHHDGTATRVVEKIQAPSPPPPGRKPSRRRRDRSTPENRGVVATRPISKGTVLVRIPGHLALGGHQHRGSACGSSIHKNIIHSDPGDSSNSTTQDDNDGPSSHSSSPPPADPLTTPAASSMSSGVSPWLECLMALYEAKQQQHEQPQLEQQEEEPSKHGSGLPRSASESTTDRPPHRPAAWGPYLDTIPTHFDTLLDWTDDQLQFLKGTSLHEDHHSHQHMLNQLHRRYLSHVRPRLLERRLVPDDIDAAGIDVGHTEFRKFAWACQAISTRCFHLELPACLDKIRRLDVVESSNGSATAYPTQFESPTGPYFLPVMDLLNHSNGNDRVTTLTAVPAGDGTEEDTTAGISYFEMVAERDVKAGEPITHSYGSSLTSAQCLQTFGFVSHEAITTMAATTNVDATDVNSSKRNTPLNRSPRSYHASPVILSKELVLACCQRTAEHVRRNRDKRIGVYVKDDVDDDAETWELPSPDAILGRDLSSLPDHIAITVDQPLSDDLVTLLCLPFLPDDAYWELLDERPRDDDANGEITTTLTSRLDASVLDDPYLGRLVGQTILEIVKDKGRTYGTIAIEGLPKERDDQSLLQDVLQWEARSGGSTTSTSSYLGAMDATTRQRLTYALTIRLEERSCLDALRREAVRILLRVTASEVDVEDDDDYGTCLDQEPSTKRQNTGSCV